MSLSNIGYFLLLFAAVSACAGEAGQTDTGRLPNIVFILADDLGYGELGCYGQEKIETPHIDALARSGMLFTQHYSGSAVCAPSRSVLLTGQHAGHTHVRGNDEWGERGAVWDYAAMEADPRLEGQRPLPRDTVTLAEVLKTKGYATGIFGKWGLGAPLTEGTPNQQGFDHFFGYNCQRQAHTFYPQHLWRNDERVFLDNERVQPGRSPLPESADPYDPKSYAAYQQNDYSADLIQEEALQFIETHRSEPFFLYYATTIPHVALQAPQRWVDYYREKFGDEEPYLGPSYFPARYPRATYAAMISYLDEQVGELVGRLKSLGIYEHTLIVFTSDNGPTYTGGVDPVFFNSAGPFADEYGRTKGFLYEGGIRVPMIVNWEGHIPAGSRSDYPSAFWDYLPTFAALAGAELPGQRVDGKNLLPVWLDGEAGPDRPYLYWEIPEYGGQQAVRAGKWKAVRKDIRQSGNLEIELYDLEADPVESQDVSDRYPEVVARMAGIMQANHTLPSVERWRLPAVEQLEK